MVPTTADRVVPDSLAAGGSGVAFIFRERSVAVFDLDRPLRRSRTNRMLTGVCGGIARWLGWDPTLVRVLYVAVSVLSAGFPGLLVYILLSFVMPAEELV